MNLEKHRRPDMSPPEFLSHLLNNFYFLFRDSKPHPSLVEHSLEEIRTTLSLPEESNPEDIISTAVNAAPEMIKKNEFYIKKLFKMAKIANDLLSPLTI